MVIFLTLVVLTLPTWDAREENEGRQLIFLFLFFPFSLLMIFPWSKMDRIGTVGEALRIYYTPCKICSLSGNAEYESLLFASDHTPFRVSLSDCIRP